MRERSLRNEWLVRALWLLARISAAVISTVMTAILFDILVLVSLKLIDAQQPAFSWESLAYLGTLIPTALLYGTIPAIATLCLTRARTSPWSAAPRLIAAGSLSALAGLWLWGVGTSAFQFIPALSAWWTVNPILVVTTAAFLGALAVTLTLPRSATHRET